MLKLPEQTRQNAMVLLAKAIHPNHTYREVNQTIKDLQNLKPVEKPKKKGK